MTSSRHEGSDPSSEADAGRVSVREGEAPPFLDALERFEPDQPLVFFRESWDFRWLSGRQVLARLGIAESSPTIVDERGDFEEPPELSAFIQQLEGLFSGGEGSPAVMSEIQESAETVTSTLRRGQRPSVVLPDGGCDGTHFTLRLGLELGAAFILPPDPSTFVWTVCTTRPTLIAASDEALSQYAADLAARSGWRRRRLVSATRCVIALGLIVDGKDALRSLKPLMTVRTEMLRVGMGLKTT